MTDQPSRADAARRVPLVAPLLALAAVVIHATPGASEALEYDRIAIAAGEWWRALTCHLTHVNTEHLLWDVAALLVLGVLVEKASRPRAALGVALCAVVIPAGLWVVTPELIRYRGLSGIDTALFVVLALEILVASRCRWIPLLLLAALAGKAGYEVFAGRTIFVDSVGSDLVPVPLAHLLGAMCGAFAFFSSQIEKPRIRQGIGVSATVPRADGLVGADRGGGEEARRCELPWQVRSGVVVEPPSF